MNILITGAAGFIGSNLSEFFLNQGHTVYGIDNFITGHHRNIKSFSSSSDFHFFEKDIISYSFSDIPPVDIIYHLASPASPDKYRLYPIETLMVNSLGTKNVLDFMVKSKSKTFVITSTSEVYGDPLQHPQTEEYWGNVNPNGERSCYDEGKRFAEALVMTYFRKHHVDVRIARLFNTYGERMEQNDGRIISNFIYQTLAKKPITVYGDGKQTRSFCYISDMVHALNKLGITKNISGTVVNLGNPDERSVLEIAHLIKEMTQSDSSIEFFPIGKDDPAKRKPDISKAKKTLSWEPTVKLQDGLTKTITYFKETYFTS